MIKRAHTDIDSFVKDIESKNVINFKQNTRIVFYIWSSWKLKIQKKEEVLKKGLALIGRQIFFHDINELKK